MTTNNNPSPWAADSHLKTIHTPGPWILDEHHGEIHSQGARSICKFPNNRLDTPAYNHCEHYSGRILDKANAQLILASPEMLKALEGVLHHNDGVKEAHKLPNSLVREIIAALVKAKGYPADGVRGDVLPIN